MSTSTQWLFAIASRGATGLLIWSWQALVLVAFVWLGIKICRVKSPASRHQIWLFSLIAVALLPPATELTRRYPAIGPASQTLGIAIESPRRAIEFVTGPGVQSQPAAEPRGNPAKAWSQPGSWLSLSRSLLFFTWLVGALIMLMRLAGNQAALRRVHRRAKLITAADLIIPEFPRLSTGKVSLRLSGEVASPMLCGAFRPTILLPADIAEWTTCNERSTMVQHELAHVERLDPLVNLFQTALRVVFFFHPFVRYGCRQLSLERELACDDRVVALGADTETYAEGLLKVAERCLLPSAGHQLAFFSAKQILERRIGMILNGDRARAGARQWKSLVLSAGLIAIVAWMLLPSSLRPGLAQAIDNSAHKLQVVKALGVNKAFDELIEMALRNPDWELRRLAAIRLTELEGDGSTQAMVELYSRTNDPQVKTMLIDTMARISEIEPLTKIALSDQNAECRLRALQRIKFIKGNSESNDVKNWDVSSLANQLNKISGEGPPPAPPPIDAKESKKPSRHRSN
jgi:beta-lactamase regulating signal transducer with metallopeptidase domain